MLIRPFAVSDQQAARHLIVNGLAEHFGYVDETCNPDVDDITANYLAQGHIFLVAQLGDQLIGTGALMVRDYEGQIVRVSIAPDYRRQGIAKIMVGYLISEAQQRSLTRLIVETNKTWQPAIRLYESAGFVEFAQDEIHVYLALALNIGNASPRP